MIISDDNKYLFIEIPRTGCTAIGKELVENYKGVRILSKHSGYYNFLKSATDEQKKYFVFAGVRNPLDRTVSEYFKMKNNHHSNFTHFLPRQRFSMAKYLKLKKYNYLINENPDFSSFFLKFNNLVYDDISSLYHNKIDYFIRFENLDEDFSKVLKMLGLEQIRPIPLLNKTSQKKPDFQSYYSPEAIKRAKRLFNPFMNKWGYSFPPEWGKISVSPLMQVEFTILGFIRKLYIKHFEFKKR